MQTYMVCLGGAQELVSAGLNIRFADLDTYLI